MKILIKIQSDSELISYEAIALGFTLASFDHEIQFYLTGDSHVVLMDKGSRIYGMIQSLELYDIMPAWAHFDDEILVEFDDVIISQINKIYQINEDNFNTVLVF